MQLSRVEADLAKLAYKVKQKLSDKNIGHFTLKFEFSGRTEGGDIKYKAFVSEYDYSPSKAEAGNVELALEEYLRREGFEKDNNTLCLPSVMPEELNEDRVQLSLSPEAPKTTDDDEIPF